MFSDSIAFIRCLDEIHSKQSSKSQNQHSLHSLKRMYLPCTGIDIHSIPIGSLSLYIYGYNTYDCIFLIYYMYMAWFRLNEASLLQIWIKQCDAFHAYDSQSSSSSIIICFSTCSLSSWDMLISRGRNDIIICARFVSLSMFWIRGLKTRR